MTSTTSSASAPTPSSRAATSGYDQYVKLIDEWDYKKLGDYLHEKFPGTVVINVGEKGYQVESMAASSSDWYVRMGSKKKVADLPDPSARQRAVDRHVPRGVRQGAGLHQERHRATW